MRAALFLPSTGPENRFTGWTDIDLSKKGEHEAEMAGKTLENISRDQIAANIRSARLTNLADGYLAELRTKATVVFK